MKLKSVIIRWSVFAALASVLTACDKPSDANEIRIGAILPLTGAASFYGESGRRGVELAEAFFKAEHPDVNVHIEIVDDKGEVKGGLTAVGLLKAKGVDYIVGPMMSGVALACASAYKDKNLTFVFPTATTPALRGFADNVFRTCVSDDAEGGEVAEYIGKTMPEGTRIATLHLNNEYGLGITKAFVERLKANGRGVVASAVYEADDRNLKEKLLKVLSAAPEAIFLVGQKEQKLVVRQLRTMGYCGGIYGTTMFEDPELLQIPEMEGAIYSSRVLNDGTTGMPSHPLYAAYKAKYDDGVNYYTASCFDSATMALKSAWTLRNNAQLKANEAPLKLEAWIGATGSMALDDKHDVVQPFSMKRVVKGGNQEILK